MGGRMDGKVVIITGAGSGIGQAAAVRVAEEGGHVVIMGRRQSALDETAGMIKATKKGSVETLSIDISDLDGFAAAIRNIAKKHGRLDGLVNNAMSVGMGQIVDITLEAWRRDFLMNADAVFIGTQEAMRIMLPQKRGSIVNISSTNGVRAMPYMASYSASKAALIQFSQVAAMEGAPHGVRVNAIAPGQIATPAVVEFVKADPDRAGRSAAAIPMGRSGNPVELGNAILYLLSDESTYTTGICLCVDGGKSAQLYVPM
jgi:meso-butanediol dehydrogenase/(S,S)-butanediol dehydrogenase/diacetyl reductase